MILAWSTVWNANWRPCFENSFDSHVRYLHRNSALMLMQPIYPGAYPPGMPKKIGPHRLVPTRPVRSIRPAGGPTFSSGSRRAASPLSVRRYPCFLAFYLAFGLPAP